VRPAQGRTIEPLEGLASVRHDAGLMTTNMTSGGGSLLDGGSARWVGPGGQDIEGTGVIARHAYDAQDNGNAKLLISDLRWDSSGWPMY
jgi:hypothetical protein